MNDLFMKNATLNGIYKDICLYVYSYGEKINNTYEITNFELKLTNPTMNNIINLKTGKNPSIRYLLAENIWYASGSQETKFIGRFACKWLTITDNGFTSNSAYGNIIKYRYGFNQLDKIIHMLKLGPFTRRAIININCPNENLDSTLDEECTMYMHFLLRKDKLDLHVYMRSNDLIYGLPYDIPAFIGIQMYVANQLEVEVGNYYHHVGSLHYYVEQENLIKDIIKSDINFNSKYKIDFIKLWSDRNAEKLYSLIEANDYKNIKEICEKEGILKC